MVNVFLTKIEPIQASFLIIFVLSHHNSNLNINTIDVVLGDRTWGHRMVGADVSTGLCWLSDMLNVAS